MSIQTTPEHSLVGFADRLGELLPADAPNRADRLVAAARIEAAGTRRVSGRNGPATLPIDSRVLLRSDQVAELLAVPVSTVQALSRKGELPTVHVGRTNRYRLAAIEAWIEANER